LWYAQNKSLTVSFFLSAASVTGWLTDRILGAITAVELFTNQKGEISGKGAINFDTIEAGNSALLKDGEQFLGL
jgi:hypothetical protein